MDARLHARGPLALGVRGLDICFDDSQGRRRHAVRSVSLSVAHGEALAIVGPSGCGKSVTLRSIAGIQFGRPGVTAGRLSLGDRDGSVHELPLWRRPRGERRKSAEVEALRRSRVGLVLQNGRAALSPYRTVGEQLESVLGRLGRPAPERRTRALELLRSLGFEDPRDPFDKHAHSLSGGMAQRAALAVVLAREPQVLLLDEVTTGLDRTHQARLVDLLLELRARSGHACVFVTHDIGVARVLADDALVMSGGRVKDRLPAADLARAGGAWTRHFVQASSYPTATPRAPIREASTEQVAVRGVARAFEGRGRSRQLGLRGIDLSIRRGECVGVIGESGSGKTTLARIVCGALGYEAGTVRVAGTRLSPAARRPAPGVSVLFQDATTGMNQEMTAREWVSEAVRLTEPRASRSRVDARASEELSHFDVDDLAGARLGSLSGGQRRRVGLARALARNAELFILDEPTNGLDAMSRRRVGELVLRLRERGRTVLLISHDLAFTRWVADRAVVLWNGTIVDELGPGFDGEIWRPKHGHAHALELVRASEWLEIPVDAWGLAS